MSDLVLYQPEGGMLERRPDERPLDHAVSVGLLGLSMFDFPNTPHENDLPTIQRMWQVAVRGAGLDDSAEDVARVNNGFVVLAARTLWWPMPVNLLRWLPPAEFPPLSVEEIETQEKRWAEQQEASKKRHAAEQKWCDEWRAGASERRAQEKRIREAGRVIARARLRELIDGQA